MRDKFQLKMPRDSGNLQFSLHKLMLLSFTHQNQPQWQVDAWGETDVAKFKPYVQNRI